MFTLTSLLFYDFRLGPGAGYRSDEDSSSSSSPSTRPPAPLIFTNALHVAVEQGAVEVARLLLKYGLEPNQGGRLTCEAPTGGSPMGFFIEAPSISTAIQKVVISPVTATTTITTTTETSVSIAIKTPVTTTATTISSKLNLKKKN